MQFCINFTYGLYKKSIDTTFSIHLKYRFRIQCLLDKLLNTVQTSTFCYQSTSYSFCPLAFAPHFILHCLSSVSILSHSTKTVFTGLCLIHPDKNSLFKAVLILSSSLWPCLTVNVSRFLGYLVFKACS